MKIRIETNALEGRTQHMLSPSALFALKYLQNHGYELSFSLSDLSDRQAELIKNEQIVANEFSHEQADANIRKSENHLQFLAGGNIVEEEKSWNELCRKILFPSRRAEIKRDTKETRISVSLNLDGNGTSTIETGISFFDHMLEQIARHGLIDLDIRCEGDLHVDEHHTIEDTAIALGQAIKKAISDDKTGIQRYGFILPMDESQATVSIDLSDRPYLEWDVPLKREYVGDFPTEMLEHFFYTIAMNGGATLHVRSTGKNEHHMIESVFKGFAKALRFAVSRNERTRGILPTTKGKI